MEKVQNVIGIPVPKVLDWDDGISNSAESEYILMEEAKGTRLDELWTDMRIDDKWKIVAEVVAMQKKLQSAIFSRLALSSVDSYTTADGGHIGVATSTSSRMLSKAVWTLNLLASCQMRPGHTQKSDLQLGLPLNSRFGNQN